MALCDLADDSIILPQQLVLDTSLLLALRQGDDNPFASTALAFLRRLRNQVINLQTVAWLPTPVLQECYHIILSHGLRRTWEGSDLSSRSPNWLAAYKRQPSLLRLGFGDLDRFDELLASIPLTVAQPDDLATSTQMPPLEERMGRFIRSYDLLPQDALILAHAERLGVAAVATLDSDWRRVTEFDIYTTPT